MSMHRRPDEKVYLTLELSWQRVLAILCIVAALIVLGYGLVRPRVSTYVGQQVSRQVSERVAAEVADTLVESLRGGPIVEPAGNSQAPAAAVTQAVQQSGASATAPQVNAPAAQVEAGSIVSAVVAQIGPTTAGERPAAAAQGAGEAQATGGAPAAEQRPEQPTAAPGSQGVQIGPTAAIPTPVVATPIAAPQSERSVAAIVQSLPSGELTVTDEKLNGKIAARVASMAPIERIVVRFAPGEVQVTLTVLGQETIASSGLSVADGKLVVLQPELSGPLGMLISAADLVRPIEEELNATLELAGRQVQAVRVEQGQIVVTMN